MGNEVSSKKDKSSPKNKSAGGEKSKEPRQSLAGFSDDEDGDDLDGDEGFDEGTADETSASPKLAKKSESPKNKTNPTAKRKKSAVGTLKPPNKTQGWQTILREEKIAKDRAKACKKTYIKYHDFVTVRRAIEKDEATLLAKVMAENKLKPTSKPENALALSKLDWQGNTILHYIIFFCAPRCFELMLHPREWGAEKKWTDTCLHEALELGNLNHVSPRQMLLHMLSDTKAVLEQNYRDKKSEMTQAGRIMAQLSVAQACDAKTLLDLVQQSFGAVTRMRAIRQSDKIIAERTNPSHHESKGECVITVDEVNKVRARLATSQVN